MSNGIYICFSLVSNRWKSEVEAKAAEFLHMDHVNNLSFITSICIIVSFIFFVLDL